MQGNHLVTQKDLEGLVGNWDSACRFLTLLAGPQVKKEQYFSVDEVLGLVSKYKANGAILNDFLVVKNDIARMLGYSNGRVGDYLKAAPNDAQATVWIRNGRSHYNLGFSSGAFRWESWDGGNDRIPLPSEYQGLYFY